MKKLFTLFTAVMLSVLAVNATDGYRRTWDFRNGYSASTLEIMAQDTKHWTVQGTGFQNTKNFSELKAVMTYNGEDIPVPELEGLTLGGMKSAAHVQIYDGKSKNTSFPDLACLWINGKNSADYISFTVPAGENVKIGYCSHSATDARGFSVSSGFADAAGNTKFTSKAEGKVVEVELINSNTEESTLKLQSTSGHHIYYIIIGEGDVPAEYNIGYLYYDAAGDGFENLPLYNAVKDMEHYTFKPVNLASAAVPTQEELGAYDAVVIDGSLQNNASILEPVKSYIFFQPVVNFCSSIAEAFGFGETLVTESEAAWAVDMKNAVFENFANWATDGGMFAISQGEVMPKPLKVRQGNITKFITYGDEELAFGDSVISYAYNDGHNSYIYYGLEGDYAEGTEIILQNIMKAAATSKAEVTACPKPAFTAAYSEMKTVVTLSCLNKNAVIYYTIDGTEPTMESAVYKEPITFTTETTIKAIAVADGYTVSESNTFDVQMFHQAKAPQVYATYADTEKNSDAIVSLTSTEGELVDIWYNFTGSNDTLKSSKYIEPITIKTVATITAFAIGKEESLVKSELTEADIKANMLNVRRDELAHFTADTWNTLDNLVLDGQPQTKWTASNYYFTWGKTAQKSFEEIGDPITDDNGDPITDDNGNYIYNTQDKPVSVTENTADTDWKITSRGQVMVFQSNTVSANIGDFGGYNPERAEDFIEELATKNDIQFAGKASGDKNTATIESTKTYEGKLSIVAIVANINGDKNTGVASTAKVAIQVSADGNTWETVGDTLTTGKTYRNYKKLEVCYDAEVPVYVRLASISGSSQGVHDIYVFNHGEKSAAAEEDYKTGVEEVEEATSATAGQAIRVLKNGQVLIIKDGSVFTVAGAKIK